MQPVHFDPSQYLHLDELILEDNYQRDAKQVNILVGVDSYYSIIENRIERSMNNNGPIAIKLKLGWILCGQSESQKQERVATVILAVEEDIYKTLKSFWELDSIGILNGNSLQMKEDEIDALKQFKEGLSFDRERYEVSIPWRKDHSNKPLQKPMKFTFQKAHAKICSGRCCQKFILLLCNTVME